MNLYIQVIFYFIVTICCSCEGQVKYQKESNLKIDTLKLLTENNWNIVALYSDPNLYKFNNQPLYFIKGIAYFFDQRIAELSLVGDTICLMDTTYTVTSDGIDLNPNVDIYLIGKIEKISKDSLIIRKIYGRGRPFYFNDNYVFFNDTLSYDPDIRVNRIVFSASTCFGDCPAMAMEIFSDGSLKFFGGVNSKTKGNYKGVFDTIYLRTIQDEIRMANISAQPNYFPVPTDAQVTEIIIYYNDSLRKEIKGYSGNFPPRLKNIVTLIYKLYKSAKIKSVTEELNFETKVHKQSPLPPPTQQ